MEMGDTYSSKRSRSRNGAVIPAPEQRKDEEEDDRNSKSDAAASRGLLQPWQQHPTASRIYRVARASGGKDRHSKVMTAKGLRDRRVRLSVSTAIQFYDLQDRLGYDQPSKAIEWLIKAAAAAISELPSLDGVFSDQPLPLRHLKPDDEKPVPEQDDDDDVSEMQFSGHHHQHHQHFSLARSTCSSTSETSRSSVLSLSRSEIHAKTKDKETEADAHQHSLDPCAGTPQSSFTELLTGHLPTADYHFRKQLLPAVFGNTSQLGDHFMGQLVPYGVTASGGDLINFSISAGISGLNRGTLQSNSPSPALHQHLQRYSSPGDGLNLPLFLAGAAAHPSVGAEGQLPAGFDSRLQLCYQGFRNADLKGKEKS